MITTEEKGKQYAYIYNIPAAFKLKDLHYVKTSRNTAVAWEINNGIFL